LAWGRPWPTEKCTIYRREILLNETDNGSGDEDMDIDCADDNLNIPETETFDCLLKFDLLQEALDLPNSDQKLRIIVVLREYEYLRRVLENEEARFVLVIGHPGTGSSIYCPPSWDCTSQLCILKPGKTVSIFHILLDRLEKKLPTAVQFLETEYVIFNTGGALVQPTSSAYILPEGCWCFCDGNASVKIPCHPFMRSKLRTFLVTSPALERYKKWRNEFLPTPVITALPRIVEVAAIA
jgi:hypothetical protein